MFAVLREARLLIYHPDFTLWARILLGITLFVMSSSAFAGDDDILSGTDTMFWATFRGTGKKYIYAAEGILALASYVKTKNVLVLTGIVVVSVFFNMILKLAGATG